ncbi:MAG TPA: CPBP family intramembrane glutamic endopeptidase [Limnochordia bacterium]|nr:CPBP family intramembrane glutamic endopeptidase [Limnochordia bacterium]
MNEHQAGRVQPIDDRPAVIFLIIIVAMALTPIVAGFVGATLSGTRLAPYSAAFAVLAQEVVLAGATLWRLKALGVPISSLRLLVDEAQIALSGLAGGGVLLVTNVLSSQISALFFDALLGAERLAEWLAREQASVRRLFDPDVDTLQLGLMVFLAVGIAPFVEELFFRGYAYPVLKRHLGRHAAWVSALLFAAVHLYVINFLPIFLIGLLLARLYERTGALAVPILAHATANGAVAILAIWLQRWAG